MIIYKVRKGGMVGFCTLLKHCLSILVRQKPKILFKHFSAITPKNYFVYEENKMNQDA